MATKKSFKSDLVDGTGKKKAVTRKDVQSIVKEAQAHSAKKKLTVKPFEPIPHTEKEMALDSLIGHARSVVNSPRPAQIAALKEAIDRYDVCHE